MSSKNPNKKILKQIGFEITSIQGYGLDIQTIENYLKRVKKIKKSIV